MSERLRCDICVIGAGSGGLSVAAGAAQLGASTVLIEGGRMGGDCLNYGCVPSKALIAAAAQAAVPRHAAGFGIDFDPPQVDWPRIRAHIRGVIAAIAPQDSVERFEGLGVRVIRDWAQFVSPRAVMAGGLQIEARRFVIAVGSAPSIPPIPGLDAVPFLTNETVFGLEAPIRHLIVIGGGPIGAELAQAHARLGVPVTVIEQDRLLPREEPGLVAFVRRALVADGVDLREGHHVTAAERKGEDVTVHWRDPDGRTGEVSGSHVLVAVGRRPNLAKLALDAGGIVHSPRGIAVDARLRSSNKRVFAIGDCADLPGTGPLAFTHVAGYHAGIVIRNALFRLPTKIAAGAMPRVTFTDPELAVVGLSPSEARAGDPACQIVDADFAENDRARTGRVASGLVRVVASARGRILGVAVVGVGAGELLAPWCLAIGKGLKLSALAQAVLPYPTLGEASKQAAGRFYAPKLFGTGGRRLVRWLSHLP
jgi:pyruvate/2-oxoglutarate dehydrogenase complex dihydrolipoamide dehydrogenase (E3) component